MHEEINPASGQPENDTQQHMEPQTLESEQSPEHHRLLPRALRYLLAAIIALISTVQGVIILCLVWWSWSPIHQTMFTVSYQLKGLLNEQPEITHQWVDESEISDHFKRAVITAEDARFLEHYGFDWTGIQQALKRNDRQGKIVAGGSTLTQQLAKNLFLTNHRSYLRKAQEAVIALYIEALWSKNRILEVYMNSVELGEGIYGVEAAAQHYFQHSAKTLTQNEAIQLAAMLPNPRHYQVHFNGQGHLARQRAIRRYFHHTVIP